MTKNRKHRHNPYTFIDLFAGAGGLSEGFVQAGFKPIAHVEMNPYAAKTLETRSAYYYLRAHGKKSIYYDYLNKTISREELLRNVPRRCLDSVINEEMSDKTLSLIFGKIDNMIKQKNYLSVDVVVGGPPCQAYSLVGRAQSSHMETPMEEDPRNDLYKLYVRFLTRYRPRVFVFENVMGIESANDGRTWKKIKAYMRHEGYDIECKEQNAGDFGVLQNRRRMIIVGWLRGSEFSYPIFKTKRNTAIVRDLLDDLPDLLPGKASSTYKSSSFSEYVKKNRIRESSDVLTLHAARSHKDNDIKIYKKAIKLWNNGHKRLKYTDLPEELITHSNTTSFLDRFKVVEGDLHRCHTMLAHISKDGHYFIHPSLKQHRSLTVREAARIQSFPDNYFFEGPRTAQFVQVGNAVPPMMAKGIAEAILKELYQEESSGE